jgi:AraC-like DNA-binding protein
MMKKRREMEYRYYEMPEDSYVFALTGKSWIRKYGEGYDTLHFHNYMEIGVCHDGNGEMIYEDKVYPFKPGCYTIIPPNFPHVTNSVPGTYAFWEYLFVDCDGLINQVCNNKLDSAMKLLEQLYRRAYFFGPGEQPELLEYIQKLFREQIEKKPLYKSESDALLTLMLLDVIRLEEHGEEGESREDVAGAKAAGTDGRAANDLQSRDSGLKTADNQKPEEERLRPAIQYIKEHYMEEIYIGTLADACALSETHFRRLFHECTHLSPLDYINSVRIHNACVALRSTDKTIRSVAFDTGFTSVSTFERNFRKYVGMATHEWRYQPENYEYKLLKYKINTYEGW